MPYLLDSLSEDSAPAGSNGHSPQDGLKELPANAYGREETPGERVWKLPSLSRAKQRVHEKCIQELAQQAGVKIDSLPVGDTEPSERFTLNRPVNEQFNPDLALSDQDIRKIFSEPEDDDLSDSSIAVLEFDEGACTASHLFGLLPSPKSESNFGGGGDDAPDFNRGMLGYVPPSKSKVRNSVPSGLRGGSRVGVDLIRGKRIEGADIEVATSPEGGFALKPRGERYGLETFEQRLKRRRADTEFVNFLERCGLSEELKFHAARQEEGFRIVDYATQEGCPIGVARRFQTKFNKMRDEWLGDFNDINIFLPNFFLGHARAQQNDDDEGAAP